MGQISYHQCQLSGLYEAWVGKLSPSELEILLEVEVAAVYDIPAVQEVKAFGAAALQVDKEAVVLKVLKLGHTALAVVSVHCQVGMNLPLFSLDFSLDADICIYSHTYSFARMGITCHTPSSETHPTLDHAALRGHLEA